MKVLAHYQVESDLSIVSDSTRLKVEIDDGTAAFIKNISRASYSVPFLLSVQIVFDAPSLDQARELGTAHLVRLLNAFALVTSAAVRTHRTLHIVEYGPGRVMRSALLWDDGTRFLKNPEPIVDEEFAPTLAKVLNFQPPPAIARALRWYRLGVHAPLSEDQFQYFWFALEILAEHLKPTDKVHSKCPHCKGALYCATCESHPMHRPFPKQAIEHLIRTVVPKIDDSTLQALDTTRNALMHGSTSGEIESNLNRTVVDVVDTVGKIVRETLIRQLPPEALEKGLHVVEASTYARHELTSIATVSTIVPIGSDGALDDGAFAGLKMSVVASMPPQSERVMGVVLKPEQVETISKLAFLPHAHQEICRRLFDHVRENNGQIVAPLFSADVAEMRRVVDRNESSPATELFRDLIPGGDGAVAQDHAADPKPPT